MLPKPLPQPSGDLSVSLSASLFFLLCFVFIRLSLGTRSLCTREHFAFWTYLACPLLYKCFYMCAWACHNTGQSCCGIFISPGSALLPLCLTKPVHCFLIITRDSQGRKGAQSWGGGWEARAGLGMDEIMLALFFNFLKNKWYLT